MEIILFVRTKLRVNKDCDGQEQEGLNVSHMRKMKGVLATLRGMKMQESFSAWPYIVQERARSVHVLAAGQRLIDVAGVFEGGLVLKESLVHMGLLVDVAGLLREGQFKS